MGKPELPLPSGETRITQLQPNQANSPIQPGNCIKVMLCSFWEDLTMDAARCRTLISTSHAGTDFVFALKCHPSLDSITHLLCAALCFALDSARLDRPLSVSKHLPAFLACSRSVPSNTKKLLGHLPSLQGHRPPCEHASLLIVSRIASVLQAICT